MSADSGATATPEERFPLLGQLESGTAVIGRAQFLPGYSLLLSHVPGAERLTDLPRLERIGFLADMEAPRRGCRAGLPPPRSTISSDQPRNPGQSDPLPARTHRAQIRLGTRRTCTPPSRRLSAGTVAGASHQARPPTRRSPRRTPSRTGAGDRTEPIRNVALTVQPAALSCSDDLDARRDRRTSTTVHVNPRLGRRGLADLVAVTRSGISANHHRGRRHDQPGAPATPRSSSPEPYRS